MKKIILIVAVVVVVLIAVGAVLFLFVFNDSEEGEAEPVYIEYALDTQYSNIKPDQDAANGTRRPVLKYTPVIQYTAAGTAEMLDSKRTEIINEMRKYFVNRNSAQLEQIDRVQEDLTDLVIEVTGSDPDTITNVFFSEFIIQ